MNKGRQTTPILSILKNEKLNETNERFIVEFLLENIVQINTEANDEIQILLTELLPNRELTPVHMTSWDFNELMKCLRHGNEIEFIDGLNCFATISTKGKLNELFKTLDMDRKETLLISAIRQDFVAAIERMLRLGADVNYGFNDYIYPAQIACNFNRFQILGLLLMSPNIKLFLSELYEVTKGHFSSCDESDKCFNLLLKSVKIDINGRDLNGRYTALDHAILNRDDSAITKLLNAGAYMGNDKCELSLIDPEILEKHFDDCIARIKNAFLDEIVFDLKNFIPSEIRAESKITKKNNETDPITCMSKKKELRRLIEHPLVASFLFLKWHRWSFVFYLNFVVCALFVVSNVTYILVYFHENGTSTTFSGILQCIIFLLTLYLILRELSQIVLSPFDYIQGWENFLEFVLIVLTFMILTSNDNSFTENNRRGIAAVTTLLMAFEFLLLAGSLPIQSFSTHYIMWITVVKTFLKGLLLYSIIIIAFGLSFFILFREPIGDSEYGISFNNISSALMRVFVMASGEFEVGTINFHSNPWNCILFLGFVFFITTVFMSLLNGLVFGDTQVIFKNNMHLPCIKTNPQIV